MRPPYASGGGSMRGAARGARLLPSVKPNTSALTVSDRVFIDGATIVP